MHPLLNATKSQEDIYFIAALLFLVLGVSILAKGLFRPRKPIKILFGAVCFFFGFIIGLIMLFE